METSAKQPPEPRAGSSVGHPAVVSGQRVWSGAGLLGPEVLGTLALGAPRS